MKRAVSLFVVFFILLSFSTPAHAVSSSSTDEFGEYAYMAGKYLLTRGIGGWGLEVQIQPNGCFTGNYSNTEYGERDEAYPNGTVYFSQFSGKLGNLTKINRYTYSARISEQVYDKTPGDEEIIDGVRYAAVPIGFGEVGETVYIYTPDAPVSQLPQEFIDWVEWPNGKITTSNLGLFGLYNSDDSYFGGMGFYQIETYTGEDPKNVVSCRTVSFGNGINVDLNWGWELFNKNASEYDHNLAMTALLLSAKTYSGADAVEQCLKENLGFCDYHFARYRNDPSPFEPGRSIAAQKISIDGKDKIIIAVVIRGTSNVAPDWITNISAVVDGFAGATSEVMKDINDSMGAIAKELGCDLTKDNTIFYIMGHSQGGAVAGLIANSVLSYADSENIFTYTFASPNYDVDNNDATSYTNVHNIINTDDFIPQCYRDWNIAGIFGEQGFKRYGNDWWYDRVDYESTAKEVYAKTGEKSAHDTETYLACLLSGPPKNMGDGVANPYSLSSIHCPVDIIVYNSDGVEMGRTEGSEVMLSEDTEVIIYLDGDSKYIMASTDKEYRIQFTATGNGTMTYSQAIVNSYTGEPIEIKEFCNVELYDGKLMTAKFGGETETNEVGLYVQNEFGETVAQIGVDGKETTLEINNKDDNPTAQDNLPHKTVVVVVGAGLLLIVLAVLATMLKRKNRGF